MLLIHRLIRFYNSHRKVYVYWKDQTANYVGGLFRLASITPVFGVLWVPDKDIMIGLRNRERCNSVLIFIVGDETMGTQFAVSSVIHAGMN